MDQYIQDNPVKLTFESFILEYDNYTNIFNEDYFVVKESVTDLKEKVTKFFKGIIEKIKKFFSFIMEKAKLYFRKLRSKVVKNDKVSKDFITKTINNFTTEEIDKIYGYNNGNSHYYDNKLFGFSNPIKVISNTSVVNQIQQYVISNIDSANTDQGMFDLYSNICDKIFANFDKSLFDGFTKSDWDECMINNNYYPALDTVKFKSALDNMKPMSGFDSKKFIDDNINMYINGDDYQKKALGGFDQEQKEILKMINILKDAYEKMYRVTVAKIDGEQAAFRNYSIFQAFSFASITIYNVYAVSSEYLFKSMATSAKIMARSYAVICSKWIGSNKIDEGIEQADKIIDGNN